MDVFLPCNGQGSIILQGSMYYCLLRICWSNYLLPTFLEVLCAIEIKLLQK